MYQRTSLILVRGVALVYFWAFASLFVQLPGTLHNTGLLPADAFLQQTYKFSTTSLQHQPPLPGPLRLFAHLFSYLQNINFVLDIVCIVGMVLSAFVLVGARTLQVHCAQKYTTSLLTNVAMHALFAVLFLCYLTLFTFGQPFLGFQWDTLLLETGFLTIFVPLRPSRQQAKLAVWMYRFLLFRLMFASGVVKLTSNCPQWWSLSALQMHWETTPLPTWPSWYASHYLSSSMQQLGVVLTLWIEIIWSLFFFSSLRTLRHVSAALQIILQGLIILTGSYGFFNVLTLVLCLSLFDDQAFSIFLPGQSREAEQLALVKAILVRKQLYFNARNKSRFHLKDLPTQQELNLQRTAHCAIPTSWMRLVNLFGMTIALSFLILCVRYNISSSSFSLGFSLHQLHAFLAFVTPVSVLIFGGVLVEVTLRATWLALTQHPDTFFFSEEEQGLTSNRTLIPSSRSGTDVDDDSDDEDTEPDYHAMCKFWSKRGCNVLYSICIAAVFLVLFSVQTVPFFQAMHNPSLAYVPKDVMDSYKHTLPYAITSSYGLFRTMTQDRREIVFEGRSVEEPWQEYRFRYTMSPKKVPTFISPHQPRLDWQMWFAALGSYQQNPWLVHLSIKLLQGSPEVLDLFDTVPFPDAPPTFVRATSYRATWAPPQKNSRSNSSNSYWVFSDPRPYLPQLALNNPSLTQFVSESKYHFTRRSMVRDGVPHNQKRQEVYSTKVHHLRLFLRSCVDDSRLAILVSILFPITGIIVERLSVLCVTVLGAYTRRHKKLE